MSLKNAFVTMRDRGPLVLLNASYNEISAKVKKSLLGQRFIRKKIHSYHMYLDMDDPGISRSLMLFGTREVDHKIMLERVLKPGMTVLDIGANIGYYALMELNLVGKTGKLIAVEPSPTNVQLLRRNLELNGYKNVPVIEGAISDRPGARDFFLATHSNLNTFHNTGSGTAHLSGRTISVKTYTVPEIVKDETRLDLIRMDVEGHEVEIIEGMLPAIAAGKLAPMIIFETHLSRYSDEHNMAKVLTQLFALGYKTAQLSSSYERGTRLIRERGYVGGAPIKTDGMERVIFDDVADNDAIDFICRVGGARTVLLAPKSH